MRFQINIVFSVGVEAVSLHFRLKSMYCKIFVVTASALKREKWRLLIMFQVTRALDGCRNGFICVMHIFRMVGINQHCFSV